MPISENEWLFAKAVVRGKSHIDENTPAQDYCEIQTSADGRWFVAVVSDGAGTAKRAEEGAQFVATHVVQALIAETVRIEALGPGVWVKDRIHAIVINVREQLRDMSTNIKDFNCTLVGALLGPTGGIFFHVGDGAALGSRVSLHDRIASRERGVRLWNDLIVSEPENGEYANETFFVTQNDWDKHLRVSPLPDNLDIIALMSDGAMPFIIGQKRHPNLPFIDPVITNLLNLPNRKQREEFLQENLAAPETYPITKDDKTLFVAVRRRLLLYADCEILPTVLKEDSPKPPVRPPGRIQEFGSAKNMPPGVPAKQFPYRPGEPIDVEERYDTKMGNFRPALLATILAAVALTLSLASIAFTGFIYFHEHTTLAASANSLQPDADKLNTHTAGVGMAPLNPGTAPLNPANPDMASKPLNTIGGSVTPLNGGSRGTGTPLPPGQ